MVFWFRVVVFTSWQPGSAVEKLTGFVGTDIPNILYFCVFMGLIIFMLTIIPTVYRNAVRAII